MALAQRSVARLWRRALAQGSGARLWLKAHAQSSGLRLWLKTLACLVARSDGNEMEYANSDFLFEHVDLPLPA